MDNYNSINNIDMDVKLLDLRKATPLKPLVNGPVAILICRYLSPLVSLPCIRKGILPNTVTLWMIISGFIGGILLMMPNIYVKTISILLYFMWFVFDCADGEVARFTKVLSKYGRELDWMAHLICHITFVLAFWLTYLQENNSNIGVVSSILLLLAAIEIVNRMLIAIGNYTSNSAELNAFEIYSGNNRSVFSVATEYMKLQIQYFPNAVLLFPVYYIIDYLLSIHSFWYIFISWSCIYIAIIVKRYIGFVIVMYKS